VGPAGGRGPLHRHDRALVSAGRRAGYEHIDAAIHDQFTWQMLAALAVFKLLATAASFSSGTPGGLFAPTLFIGAMAGGAVCGAARVVIPGFEGDTGLYALVGMGTLFAGILRAPITSVFMILEVSGSYAIVLPVMISNMVAYVVSRQYQRDSIFDVVARQDGMDLPSMEHRARRSSGGSRMRCARRRSCCRATSRSRTPCVWPTRAQPRHARARPARRRGSSPTPGPCGRWSMTARGPC
jgi:hypothetical protein